MLQPTMCDMNAMHITDRVKMGGKFPLGKLFSPFYPTLEKFVIFQIKPDWIYLHVDRSVQTHFSRELKLSENSMLRFSLWARKIPTFTS